MQGSNPLLAVALDAAQPDRLIDLASRLEGLADWLKVGLEAYTACGPSLVRKLADGRSGIFLDLKLHDIPKTVERAANAAAQLGIRALTVHAAGGAEMVAAARLGLESAAGERPLLLAVTVLTSLDQAALDDIGLAGPPLSAVERLAALAVSAGADGLVCSPRELTALRPAFADTLLVTPGIRPRGFAAGDQRRIATPAQARAAGADVLVVGRPITSAADPAAAAALIRAEVEAP